MMDFIKTLIILIAYFGVAPWLGSKLAESRRSQRWVFSLMMVMPCFHPGKLTLMVDSWAFYRGHTKGFEANWLEVLGIGIIIASHKTKAKGAKWKLFTPGALLYNAWALMSLISVFAAPDKTFALMAGFKFSKVVIIYMAAAHFLRDEEDLLWSLRAVAGSLVFYALLCLKMRYLEGMFQIKGWFEHQNPMAMWCYMGGIPLLAVALHGQTKPKDFLIFMAGFGGSAFCILLSVSRAGLGALAAGSVFVLLMAWLRGPNSRVVMVTVGGAIGAFVVSAFAMNSFHARLNEVAATAETSEFDLRDILNMQSRAMLHDSPIGIGWNNFGIMNSRPRGDKYSQILEDWDESRGFTIIDENYHENPLTESLYWLMAAETGYPGIVFFALFALTTLWFAVRAMWFHRLSTFGAFAGGALIMLGICYLHGSVERILTQTKNVSFWLLMTGLLSGIQMMPKPDIKALKRALAKAKS
jgi:hypothetical protein